MPRYPGIYADEIRAARDQCRDAEYQLSRLQSHNGTRWGGAITEAGTNCTQRTGSIAITGGTPTRS